MILTCLFVCSCKQERLSRYRMRHALLETDIISKLLQRIADNRLGLVNYYRTVETVIGGITTVTRYDVSRLLG